MCGFLGEISSNLLSKDSFKKLLDLSINRGPDQQGFWRDSYCQLGFNRLSIIDLSENGSQPILSPSGKFAMVFNGEVYNYKELQKKYKIKNEDLRSSSDTEILAHLIEKIPVNEFAKELNGMFAVAIYDIDEKKIYLIRDFAGIKPLYYGLLNDGIIFASQFDQIFSHPKFANKKLRPEIMKEYFGLGYMQAPNTVFENIFQIEPGFILTWDLETKNSISKEKYFNWNVSLENNEMNESTINKMESVFSKSVNSQLNADVPVATFLSGGIDSPLVSCYSKINKNDIQSYTFGIDNVEYDESFVADKIAKQLNINNAIERIDRKQLLQVIDYHFKNLSEPFGDESSLPTFLITQKAKKYATVMLSGDGGDELFWGYPRFLRSVNQIWWFKIPLYLRKLIVPVFRRFNTSISFVLEKINLYGDWILYKQTHLPRLNQLFPNYKFSKELKQVYSFDKSHNKTDALLFLKENEFYAHLQKVLRKVDLMSMANSLEVRVPFLDKNVIEFSNTINPKYGIEHSKSKYVLKKLLKKHVSKEITSLPKKGFSVPIDEWLKNDLKEDLINTVLKQPIFGKKFIDDNVLKEIFSDFFQGKSNAQGIWHIYAWQKWAENYNFIKND